MDDRLIAEFWFSLDAPPSATPLFDVEDIAAAFPGDRPRFLGRGSYGETWRVEYDGRQAAAKIIHNERLGLSRLLREIEGLEKCTSPFVVDLFDKKTVPIGGKPRPALVFRYIDGPDADSAIRASWPSREEILGFAKGVVSGIAELHAKGVIHRDLKFGNVALREGRWTQPVILDLGLVRILDESSLTHYPGLIGTLPFMAPEQVRGERARKGSDLWALGVMLYILLTRRHPFYGPYAERLARPDALDRLMAGPPPLPDSPGGALPVTVNRLLSPQIFRRGSTHRLVAELEELV